jgi:hypothetical protein
LADESPLVVIFGAGASFDNAPLIPVPESHDLTYLSSLPGNEEANRPPLADALFRRRIFWETAEKYDAMLPLP